MFSGICNPWLFGKTAMNEEAAFRAGSGEARSHQKVSDPISSSSPNNRQTL